MFLAKSRALWCMYLYKLPKNEIISKTSFLKSHRTLSLNEQFRQYCSYRKSKSNMTDKQQVEI